MLTKGQKLDLDQAARDITQAALGMIARKRPDIPITRPEFKPALDAMLVASPPIVTEFMERAADRPSRIVDVMRESARRLAKVGADALAKVPA